MVGLQLSVTVPLLHLVPDGEGNFVANPRQTLGPERLSRGVGDLVLANFYAQIGPSIGLGVAVHRRVEELAGIGLLVTDEKGQTVKWGVECGSPAQMVKAGWRSSSLKPGDHVIVTVHPLRDGTAGGSFVQVQTADGKVLKAS